MILKDLKVQQYKVSQLVDVAVKTLGREALMRLITHERILQRRVTDDS